MKRRRRARGKIKAVREDGDAPRSIDVDSISSRLSRRAQLIRAAESSVLRNDRAPKPGSEGLARVVGKRRSDRKSAPRSVFSGSKPMDGQPGGAEVSRCRAGLFGARRGMKLATVSTESEGQSREGDAVFGPKKLLDEVLRLQGSLPALPSHERVHWTHRDGLAAQRESTPTEPWDPLAMDRELFGAPSHLECDEMARARKQTEGTGSSSKSGPRTGEDATPRNSDEAPRTP